ncbi:MAG: LysM peptidoglycan-binding domain-containing protein [Chlorobi bacterium]|nr:LysM peptidoglycan-binding domain-containing protein [Chlorobiota bacterium]
MKKIVLLLFFSIEIIQFGFSQVPVKISDQTVILNNKKFYLHKVKKGQTLYSLSKAYKVDQQEIIRINKLSNFEIKSGQLLKIPYSKEYNNDTSPDFFYHKVIQGETLFSLSQKYYVGVEEIIETNPVVKYGLKTGQILKIPNSFKKKRETENKKYLLYTVEKGNTLFSIAKRYNVSVDELIKLNPEAANGIKPDQVLKIPKTYHNNKEQINDSIPIDTINKLQKGLNDPLYFTEEGITPCNQFEYSKNKTFEVVLLLPLFIENNLHYISSYYKEKDPMFYKNTKRFIELYEGFLFALQKLKQQGLSVNLKVYDTENDSIKTESIMQSLNYPNIDLIIGPVYSKNIRIASKYATKHHINLVSPLSKNLSLLKNNPFVFQVIPSTEARINNISKYLSKHNDSTNLVIIYKNSGEQLKWVNKFKEDYTLYDSLHLQPDTSIFKIIQYDTDIKVANEQQEKINRALKQKYKNIIYIPSDNEVFVTQVIDKLFAANDSLDLEIIGSDKWINFQNINSAVFNRISFNFISPLFVNYNSPDVKKFIVNFRTVYKTEPSFFAFQGYDIAYYFLNTLRKYGRIFQFCVSAKDAFPNHRGLISNFNFERINTTGGFENKSSFILKFNDTFQLENKTLNEKTE